MTVFEAGATLSEESRASTFHPPTLDMLERFARAFSPCGFQRRSFVPCYGLAEATLMVTGRGS